MNLAAVAERVQKGETVTFIARGQSMHPKVRDGERVTVEPVDGSTVRKGDIVLARVGRATYLHLVSAVANSSVRISNNHGKINGWTPFSNVYGRKV